MGIKTKDLFSQRQNSLKENFAIFNVNRKQVYVIIDTFGSISSHPDTNTVVVIIMLFAFDLEIESLCFLARGQSAVSTAVKVRRKRESFSFFANPTLVTAL